MWSEFMWKGVPLGRRKEKKFMCTQGLFSYAGSHIIRSYSSKIES